MSRSYKKAIIKEKPRNYKRTSFYWKTVRRVQKQFFNEGKEIPNPKIIVNDYKYCNYIFDMEYIPYELNRKIEDQKKYRRK